MVMRSSECLNFQCGLLLNKISLSSAFDGL